MGLPTTIKTILIESQGNAIIKDVPLPQIRTGYLLVRTTAVAINPIDWKQIEFGSNIWGTKVGCDYAGVVEEVGPGTHGFKKGDRVAGLAHGTNKVQPEDGAFGEYNVVKASVAFKIPDTVKDEEGATLGLGIATVCQGLYRTLKLALPTQPLKLSSNVLIYGGATATGIIGIQLAKLSGYTVITVASPRNFAFLKTIGADAVFDYSDPERCVADIRNFTKGCLDVAWDCVSTSDSAQICAKALSTEHDSQYSSLLGVEPSVLTAINPKVHVGTSVAFVCIGEEFEEFGVDFKPTPEDYEFGKSFYEMCGRLLKEDKLKPAPQIVNRSGKGLVGVLQGLEDSKAGRVRASKLVYTF